MRRSLAVLLLGAVACQAPTTPSSTADGTGVNTPGRYTLSGVVHERHAPVLVPIANASVTVQTGPQAGRSTNTDESGRYFLAGLTADRVTVVVEAESFEVAAFDVTPPQAEADVALTPQLVTVLWDAAAQPYKSEFVVPFSVAHWGPAALSISSDRWYCGTYGYFDALIRGRDGVVSAIGLCRPGAESRTTVLAPGGYELVVQMLPLSVGGHLVRVDHPR